MEMRIEIKFEKGENLIVNSNGDKVFAFGQIKGSHTHEQWSHH